MRARTYRVSVCEPNEPGRRTFGVSNRGRVHFPFTKWLHPEVNHLVTLGMDAVLSDRLQSDHN